MKSRFAPFLFAVLLLLSSCVSSSTHEREVAEAQEAGYEEGYDAGREDGYETGAEDSYNDGYRDGAEVGSEAGYEEGYNDGYGDGYAAALGIEDPVYVTLTGTKYHRSWCSYLDSSKILMSRLSAFAQGYTPCSVCNP